MPIENQRSTCLWRLFSPRHKCENEGFFLQLVSKLISSLILYLTAHLNFSEAFVLTLRKAVFQILAPLLMLRLDLSAEPSVPRNSSA